MLRKRREISFLECLILSKNVTICLDSIDILTVCQVCMPDKPIDKIVVKNGKVRNVEKCQKRGKNVQNCPKYVAKVQIV